MPTSAPSSPALSTTMVPNDASTKKPLLPDLILSQVRGQPDKTAITYLTRKQEAFSASTSNVVTFEESLAESLYITHDITYAQLWNTAIVWAMLIENALKDIPDVFSSSDEPKFRRVGLTIAEGPALPTLHLAVILCRPATAIIPLDTNDPRLPLIIEDAEPTLIIATDDADVKLCDAALYKIQRPKKLTTVLTLSQLKEKAKKVVKELQLSASKQAFEELYQSQKYNADDVSHVFFTSGSTGRPKGCISSLGSLSYYCTAKNTAHNVEPDSIVFVASTHTFDPSLGDFVSTLAIGSTIAISTRAETFAHLSQCIKASKSTHLLTNPALLSTIHIPPAPSSFPLPSLKVVATGGEPLPVSLLKTWAPHVKLLNTFGTTECCVYQTTSHLSIPPHLSNEAEVNSYLLLSRKLIGEAMGFNQIHFMTTRHGDPDSIPSTSPTSLRPTTPNEIGEIWISGPQVGIGYLRRPELTASRFIQHPTLGSCFRTGDLVLHLDPSNPDSMGISGYIYLGRSDTQVKIRGQRVELEEIEQRLLAHKGAKLVLDNFIVVLHTEVAALVGYYLLNDEFRRECGVGMKQEPTVEPRRKRRCLQLFLLELCKSILPIHMVPSRFVLLDALLYTGTGKINRSLLARTHIEQLSIDTDTEAEEEEDEDVKAWLAVVRTQWSAVLNVDDSLMRSGTRFEELGGDSLKALQVCRNISQVWKTLRHDAKTVSDNSEGGVFGEFLGDLQPAELLKRSEVVEFSKYLLEILGPLHDANGNRTAHQKAAGKDEKEAKEKTQLEPLQGLLYQSVSLNFLPLVRLLLDTPFSLDVNTGSPSASIKQKKVTTLLHVATSNNHSQLAKLLVHHGASISAQDASGRTAVHYVSQKGNLELLKFLMNPQSEIDSAHNTTTTLPSNTTAAKNKSNSTKKPTSSTSLLLTSTDSNFQTPLHHAARSGAGTTFVSFLIAHAPTTLNSKDEWGRTPLHWASINGHSSAVKTLLENEANEKLVDSSGETALEMAERRARCGANERGAGVRSSVFGDIAKVLGGSGGTKSVKRFVE
ncbi:hypothetical protein HDV05_008246 [Chytridiales sp. JEL 0842]|nr:hypothetical protein HDV05_008246 [Chytridiales sp. JEL 0842]